MIQLVRLTASVVVMIGLGAQVCTADHRPPRAPRVIHVLGDPDRLGTYWHDQRWLPRDVYACALYAQASILEAFGYDFATELAAMRDEGRRDGWYAPGQGVIGLGQPLRTRGITFDVFGTSLAGPISRQAALNRLRWHVALGDYALVNLDATRLAAYYGSPVAWHTVWVTRDCAWTTGGTSRRSWRTTATAARRSNTR